ncbi:invasion associated locus B family protein [Rhizobium binxianense]
MFLRISFLTLPILMIAVPAGAAQPKRIAQLGAWSAYSYRDKTTTCYVLSVPPDASPRNVDHGENFFLISKTAGHEVPQAVMGYSLAPGSKIRVSVGSQGFDMFIKDNRGWLEDAGEEPALVSAMRAGQTMMLEAKSRRGTTTRYTYSLSGVTAALNTIAKCR